MNNYLHGLLYCRFTIVLTLYPCIYQFVGIWYERYWRLPANDDMSEYAYSDFLWKVTEKPDNMIEFYIEEL